MIEQTISQFASRTIVSLAKDYMNFFLDVGKWKLPHTGFSPWSSSADQHWLGYHTAKLGSSDHTVSFYLRNGRWK